MLAEHCREVGRDFDAIVRSANYNVVIGETEKDVQDKLAWIRAHYEPLVPADVAERTYQQYADGSATGTPEQLVERLAGMRDKGLAYAITYFADAAYDRSGIDLFVKHVVPDLS